MASFGLPYVELNQLQQRAAKEALASTTDSKSLASLIVAWCRAEQMKREMRGLPPLKAVSMEEFARAKMRRTKRGKLAIASGPLILDVQAVTMSTTVDKISEPTTPATEPTTVTALPPPTEAQ